MQWRCISQEGKDGLWKQLCGMMEEGVLENYKFDEANKGAYPGRGDPLNWRIVKKKNRSQLRKW